MKLKGFRYDGFVIALALISALGFAAYTAISGNTRLALFECAAIAGVFVLFLVRALLGKRRYRRMLKRAAKKIDRSDSKVLESLSYPVCVADEDGLVTWCNDYFAADVAGADLSQSYSVDRFLKGADPDSGNVCVPVGDKYFTIFSSHYHRDGKNYTVYELIDNTDLKKTEAEYFGSRPYSLIIEADNIDDSRSDFKDSEKTAIKSRVEAMIDEWSEKFDSGVRRISDDRYSIITEKKNIDMMVADKFSIVDSVRNFTYKDKNAGVTLSIGIAPGDSIRSAEKAARKAFDMALGRGGDQVALRLEDGSYKFFGGVSGSAEKYSKTKSRMLAKNLASEIQASSNVIVMGHANSDFDSVGAAVGVVTMAKALGVPANIVINKSSSLALPLVEMMKNSGMGDMFITFEQAERMLGRKSLMILVDTHIIEFSEYQELFAKCEKRTIIDHHRLIAGTTDRERIVYHEPNASSTCEMVTEYISYTLDDSLVSKEVAQALLSGIMLDTKNFVLRAGARTFEAAAYLKERGADLVEVRKLFDSSFETNKYKNNVVNEAITYKNCAIATVPEGAPESRIIAAKAADELLGISGIKASFVIYTLPDGVSISARSLGEMNVQLIMEEMGGGGHKTMAATKFAGTADEAQNALREIIDKITVKEKI